MVVAQDSEGINRVQLDSPAIQSELDMQPWIYAGLELGPAIHWGTNSDVARNPKMQRIYLKIAPRVKDIVKQ